CRARSARRKTRSAGAASWRPRKVARAAGARTAAVSSWRNGFLYAERDPTTASGAPRRQDYEQRADADERRRAARRFFDRRMRELGDAERCDDEAERRHGEAHQARGADGACVGGAEHASDPPAVQRV